MLFLCFFVFIRHAKLCLELTQISKFFFAFKLYINLMTAIIQKYQGGPVGIEALAATTGEE